MAILDHDPTLAARYEAARSRDDRVEWEQLELFRKDTGTFVRMYDFMSQVIDFGDSDLEKLCVYLRQLVRVIDVDRVATELDLSDLVLKRVKQVDRGKDVDHARVCGEALAGDLWSGLRGSNTRPAVGALSRCHRPHQRPVWR
jgi:hypothetical protein